jgi:hypothetical protein
MRHAYKLIILFLLFFRTGFVEAQKTDSTYSSHYFGMHAGFCTGIGLSYRYWPSKIGVQISCIPLKTEKKWNDLLNIQGLYKNYGIEVEDKKFISLGITGLLKVSQLDYSTIFTYWGNHFLIQKDKTIYNSGIGIGFAVNRPFGFNLMLGYGVYDIFKQQNILPSIELGFFYHLRKK